VNAVLAIGAKARTALAASGGVARPLAAFPDAPYFDAAGEIVWIGSRLPAMHPRAVVTAAPVRRGEAARFEALPSDSWSPSLPARGTATVAACARLRANVGELGEPRGFGYLLVGGTPPFPLDLAVDRVRALEAAYRADFTAAVSDASRALLGLGGGLTPSGDDLVGGALFGRLLVAEDAPRWRALGERLAAEARRASHVISAALLADLAAGASFAPLHDLAHAVAAGDDGAALAAAGTLAALGHSSGWDMLAGLLIGAARCGAGPGKGRRRGVLGKESDRSRTDKSGSRRTSTDRLRANVDVVRDPQEPRRRKVGVERERMPDPLLLHEREAGGVDEAEPVAGETPQ
jgi:hypothetical protein